LCDKAAVNHKFRPGDELGFIRSQEQHSGHLDGFPDPPHRRDDNEIPLCTLGLLRGFEISAKFKSRSFLVPQGTNMIARRRGDAFIARSNRPLKNTPGRSQKGLQI
jgi:hypothetical protein